MCRHMSQPTYLEKQAYTNTETEREPTVDDWRMSDLNFCRIEYSIVLLLSENIELGI